MSAGQHFNGMFRQNSLPRVDLLAAPDRSAPVVPNAHCLFGGFWGEGFPRLAQNCWSNWAPGSHSHEIGRRRWTQPVNGSQPEVAPVVGRASLPAPSRQLHNQYAYVTVVTPRGMRYPITASTASTASTPTASSSTRSASVGALRQPLGELVHPRTMGANPQHPVSARTCNAGLPIERVDSMPGTMLPGPTAAQSWQPYRVPYPETDTLVRGGGESRKIVHDAISQTGTLVPACPEPVDFTLSASAAVEPASPDKSTDPKPH